MKLIPRPEYMNFLKRYQDHHLIKVISGVRRCGKSTLFYLYRQYLLNHGVMPEQIITINFEDLAYESLCEYHALYRYIMERMQADKMNYIFLDEIQHVKNFEKVVDSLFIKDNADVYITGSNAYFMSGDLATLLTGRYVELSMLPLSFREFSQGMTGDMSLSEQYNAYIRISSFPYALQFQDDSQAVEEYLSGIYNTILVKDTLRRMRSSDTMMVESLMKFLAANIGSLISPNKIANSMTSAGRKIDNKTVEKYLQGLKDSLLIYQADRFDVRGKQLLKINAKYYLVDPAFRRLLINDTGRDTGHILENIVYLELLRRGDKVYVGQLPRGEIDFVVEKSGTREYYQVAESTLLPEVLERELKPLQSVPDQYPKYLLTLDEIAPEADYDGIKKKNVLRWLLEADS
ncbi:ATP-binding protein [Megasphaera elsdenii]|uniref:ATP-binding protein n=1 Tax=Megasphaera elsdenii TaxID=907 RepID=UPI0024304808|nr:ATP-binding protein [Megasphaera elsdenii]MCI7200988.1 ATP-binding protein [Megasphaera elsdenii]MDY4265444.1 ATP-binding protein [Megasphaera elsdenii]MDY4728028.1 ATP-binding protein [Megasphaera elsdenii]